MWRTWEALFLLSLPSTLLLYVIGTLIIYKLRLTKTTKIVGFFIAWLITAITALVISGNGTIPSAVEIFSAATIGTIVAVFVIAIAAKKNP